MIPYDAKSHFNKLARSQYFIRADSTHPLELYLGIDKDGRKALRFIGDFTVAKVNGTKAIAVKHFSLNGRNCLQLSLLDPEAADPFYKFVDDLVDASRKLANPLDGYRFVISRYNRWKKMFLPSREILSEPQIMGLLGELHFMLSYLIPKYGEETGVLSWSASDPTVKDFSIGDDWFELKTTGPKSPTIRINSLQQLESTHPGKLVVIRLEKMASTFAGMNLNIMVQTIMGKVVSPEVLDEFQTKLALRGYAYSEKYNDYVYEVKAMTGYCVDKDFPKLSVDSMNDAIANAEYDLLIERLKKYITELN